MEHKLRELLDSFPRAFTTKAPGGLAFDPGENASPADVSAKPKSLQEFVRQVKPDSGPDYATAIGYYLEKVRAQGFFTGPEVRDGFTEVKFQHSNPADCVLKAKRTGRIMDGKDSNTYVLTQSGETWVEDRLKSLAG